MISIWRWFVSLSTPATWFWVYSFLFRVSPFLHCCPSQDLNHKPQPNCEYPALSVAFSHCQFFIHFSYCFVAERIFTQQSSSFSFQFINKDLDLITHQIIELLFLGHVPHKYMEDSTPLCLCLSVCLLPPPPFSLTPLQFQ